jgi:hypothetical protein
MPRAPRPPTPDALEARIAELRAAVRRAVAGGDRRAARDLRADLRQAERASGVRSAPPASGSAGPARERVRRVLELLGVPAAPKLVETTHAAFFAGPPPGSRLSHLRRDEERAFRAAPGARPFYVCAALTADRLTAARGLLTLSTWPLERRIVGPLSARADFLTAATRVAEHAGNTDATHLQRLLRRFATNIPGATDDTLGTVDPARLGVAARRELAVHRATDRRGRARAAERARARLDDAELLFGAISGDDR